MVVLECHCIFIFGLRWSHIKLVPFQANPGLHNSKRSEICSNHDSRPTHHFPSHFLAPRAKMTPKLLPYSFCSPKNMLPPYVSHCNGSVAHAPLLAVKFLLSKILRVCGCNCPVLHDHSKFKNWLAYLHLHLIAEDAKILIPQKIKWDHYKFCIYLNNFDFYYYNWLTLGLSIEYVGINALSYSCSSQQI